MKQIRHSHFYGEIDRVLDNLMDPDKISAIVRELLEIIDNSINSDEIGEMINYPKSCGVSSNVRDLLRLRLTKSKLCLDSIKEALTVPSVDVEDVVVTK